MDEFRVGDRVYDPSIEASTGIPNGFGTILEVADPWASVKFDCGLTLFVMLEVLVRLPNARPPAWTSDSPTEEGEYLTAYRFNPEDEWTRGQQYLKVGQLPIVPDTSETLYFGPIPGLPKRGQSAP
jgi:hypothetical protein